MLCSLISFGQKHIDITGSIDVVQKRRDNRGLTKIISANNNTTYLTYIIPSQFGKISEGDSIGTVILMANVKIFNGESLIYETTTDRNGKFEANNIICDTLDFTIEINESLKQSFKILPKSLLKNQNLTFFVSDSIYYKRVKDSILLDIGYDSNKAKEDIKKGNIYFVSLSPMPLELNKSDYEYLESLFGFKYLIDFPDAPIDFLFEAEEEYNAVVFEYLDSVCNCHFIKKYKREFKKIYDLRIKEKR